MHRGTLYKRFPRSQRREENLVRIKAESEQGGPLGPDHKRVEEKTAGTRTITLWYMYVHSIPSTQGTRNCSSKRSVAAFGLADSLRDGPRRGLAPVTCLADKRE